MSSPQRTSQRTIQWAASLLLLAGCSSPPAPIPAPGPLQLPVNLQQSTHHHFGTLLEGARLGPQASSQATAAPRALEIEIRIQFLEGHADEQLSSLAERTRMLATPQADNPLRGATRFAVGAGFATGQAASDLWASLEAGSAGRSTLAEPYCGALPEGLSTLYLLEVQELIEDPDNFLGEWPQREPVNKRLAVGLQLESEAGIGIGIGFSDLALGDRTDEAGAPPPEGGSPHGAYLQHEWLVPDLQPELDGGPLVFVVPSPFATGEAKSCAIWIQARTAPAPSAEDSQEVFQASIEHVLAAARATAKQLSEAQRSIAPQDLQLENLMRTYAALHETSDAARWRGLLLNIANSSEAPLTEDLAMIADERTLRDWVDSLPALAGRTQWTVTQLGWHVERSAWRFLAKQAMNEGLPLWLEALCLRHAGEVGRYPSTLERISQQSADRPAFYEYILIGNRLSLEDSNVSARVRAYDWLSRLDLAPKDFDPLGSAPDRRSALTAYNDALQATTTL